MYCSLNVFKDLLGFLKPSHYEKSISVNHILVCLGVRDFMLGAEGLSNVRICIFSSVS